MVSRAEVEEAIWRIAGRTPWHEMEKVMRIIDAYAVTMARKLGADPLPPIPVSPEKLYKCQGCGQRKILDDFPQPKRLNPSAAYHCLICQ